MKKILKESVEYCNFHKTVNFSIKEEFGSIGENSSKRNYSGEIASPSRNGDYEAMFAHYTDTYKKLIKFPCVDDANHIQKFKTLNLKSRYYYTVIANKILKSLDTFLKNEDFHTERDIPFRRGYLLHGKPGTGKSTMICEIAKKLDLPIVKFNLSTFTNKELQEATTKTSVKSIFLFEDIETVFEGRENKSTGELGGVTFDYFINLIGGVKSLNGKIVFITTNHVEKLDPALIRPGRVDEIYEIENICKEGKRHVASQILDLWPDKIDQVVNDGELDTTAEFENRCSKVALESLYAKGS